jgi:hypothetical protein
MAPPTQQGSSSTVAEAAAQIGSELGNLTSRSNEGSHKLCQYVLENVLLHQAAAQQLQVCGSVGDRRAGGCVGTPGLFTTSFDRGCVGPLLFETPSQPV